MSVARGVGQKGPHAEEAEKADRHIDIKDVAPRVVLGQPATENRAEDGAGHHCDSPHRHRRSLPLRRVDGEQHGLRERHERRAEGALQNAKQHDLRQRLRHTAKHLSNGEAGDSGEEQALETETRSEKAGRRSHDRSGYDVGGSAPRRSGLGSPRRFLGYRATRRWRWWCRAPA